MSECIFCKIVKGEIPGQVVYQNEQVLIFKDIQPMAPVHLLAIPKHHIDNICDPRLINEQLLTGIFAGIQEAADILGIKKDGFRTVVNYGSDAGEAVPHLHFHLLAGRQLAWPPG